MQRCKYFSVVLLPIAVPAFGVPVPRSQGGNSHLVYIFRGCSLYPHVVLFRANIPTGVPGLTEHSILSLLSSIPFLGNAISQSLVYPFALWTLIVSDTEVLYEFQNIVECMSLANVLLSWLECHLLIHVASEHFI